MNALHDLLAAGAGPEETTFSADDIGRRVGQRARRRRRVTAGAAVALLVVAGLAGVMIREASKPADVVIAGPGTETSPPTATTAPTRQVPVTGTVQGEAWELIVVPADRGMCLEVRLARGALKTCSLWDETVAASVYDILGDRVIAGSTTTGVASVRVRFADDTEPLLIPATSADGYERRFFAATITAEGAIAEVMALDAEGNDLEPVADLGGGVLGTGQPDG